MTKRTKLILSIVGAVILLIVLFASQYFRRDLSREELSQYIAAESKFITLKKSGANVHYRDEGDKSGPTIVLFHGGTASLTDWAPWTTVLKNSFRVISLDFPGHGLTGRIPGDEYTREKMVEVASELLEELKVKKFILAGHSMGGGIAICYTLENQDKVESLILIGSEGVTLGKGYQNVPGYSGQDEKVDTSLSFFEKMMTYYYNPKSTEEYIKIMFVNKDLVTPEYLREANEISLHTGNRYASALMFKQYFSSMKDPNDLEFKLKEIKLPVLLQFGKKDALVVPEIAERFHERLPDSKLIFYQNAGHMPVHEATEKTIDDLLKFLKRRNIIQ